MSPRLRLFFYLLMGLALAFGFLHLFVDLGPYDPERLHIFLFNLCAGGTLLLYFTENQDTLSKRAVLFLALSLFYALLAFFNQYLPAITVSLILAALVESCRIETFSFFPWEFFSRRESVSRKFHQAALLCLSLALIISAGVLTNNQYLRLVTFPKLELNVFFLGFSFPLSLITLSLIFFFFHDLKTISIRGVKEIIFWTINLGVILFFLFILAEQPTSQMVVTTLLFLAVIGTAILYFRFGKDTQQKNFLTSGIGFLLTTAVTGIAYILLEFLSGHSPDRYHWLMRLHAFVSLYGWNLSGLAVICRYNDFPIRLNTPGVILFHWITVLVLAPAGVFFRVAAVIALPCFMLLLYLMLFSRAAGSADNNGRNGSRSARV